MSLEIQTVPFDSINQKDAVEVNHQVARVLTVGSSWSTLRIGMRYSLTDAGVSLGTGPELWFGLLASPSASMANGPLTTSTSNFVGYVLYDAWTRAAAPSVHYDSGVKVRTRVGSTNTDNVIAASGTLSSAEETTIKGAFIIEIVKGVAPVTNWNTTLLRMNASSGLDDSTMTVDGLVNAMNAATMTDARTALNAVTGAGYGLPVTTDPVVVDEATNGNMNAICIAWNSGIASLHASEAFFRVVA